MHMPRFYFMTKKACSFIRLQGRMCVCGGCCEMAKKDFDEAWMVAVGAQKRT